jgi:hypothetical protein
MGPRCSSTETQVCHRSYIIAARKECVSGHLQHRDADKLMHMEMLFKGSNNLVQIYRSFSITGNYGRRSFSKYGISYYTHSRLNRQIRYRHPNSEAGNDEIQNVQREDFILWELHSKILVGDKNLL